MATTNVRLKDAAGNVLHPETDWSVVQNKPSIEVTSRSNTWKTDVIDIGANSAILLSDNILIKLSTGPRDLSCYPIEWEAIANKPTALDSNTQIGWVTISDSKLQYLRYTFGFKASYSRDAASAIEYYYFDGGEAVAFSIGTSGNTTYSFTPIL